MNNHFMEVNALIPFYDKLLSQRQQEIVHYYYYDNLSLGEIGENLGISRNAVYDALQKAEKAIYAYEDKLHLSRDFQFRMSEYEELLNTEENDKIKEIVSELKNREEDYE